MKSIFILSAFLLLALPTSAQVPQIINYQGRVAVGTTNFDGSGAFKFALVNAAGTTTYWSNDGTSTAGSQPTAAVTLTVTKGLYSVLLGDTTLSNMTAIPNSVFANADVRLRVWFNDGSNGSQLLTPDQRLTAVGYSIMAANVPDGAITSAKLASGLTLGGTTTGTFVGDGAGLTGITATTLPVPPGMALIQAGAFTMGTNLDFLSDATPISTTVSAFYMDVNEVTLSQWQTVQQWASLVGGYTGLAAGSGKGATHPVQTVTYFDCLKWCNARSEQEGKTPVYYTDDAQTTVYRTGSVGITNAQVKWTANGYRLPTEAEWEKAARGGLTGKRFPWGDSISQKQANHKGNTSPAYELGPSGFDAARECGGTSPATSPVGSFPLNGYGLSDMAGNVHEWCWDRYETPYAGGTDPHGSTSAFNRVLRGGAWDISPSLARCAFRQNISPATANTSIGFRCVLLP